MRAARPALIIAVLLALASCSGGISKNQGANSPSPTVSPTGSLGSGNGSNPYSSSQTPAGVLSELARPCDPVLYQSNSTGQPGASYIRATTRSSDTWGPNCEILNPGDRCHVTWEGYYVVLVGDQAHMQFQAWSKGDSKPFKVLPLGPLPPENRIQRLGFPVTIPKGTEVAFRIVLMNAAKVPVAVSDAYSYKLNCRKGPG